MIHGGEGRSRDLNGRGVFVQSRSVPPLGSSLVINILLPQPEPLRRLAELYAEGRVVRIESSASPAETVGFATMNHTVVLRDAEGRAINGKDSWKEFGFNE